MFTLKYSITAFLFLSVSLLYAQPVTWDASTSYSTGTLVIVGTSTYVATKDVPANNTPPNPTYWDSLEDTASSLSISAEELAKLPTTAVSDLLATLPGAAPDANSTTGTLRIVRLSVRGHIGTNDDERFMAFNLLGSSNVMLRGCGPALGLLDASLSSVSLLDPYMKVSQYIDSTDLSKGSTELTASNNDNYGDHSESSTIESFSKSIFPNVVMQPTESASVSTFATGYYTSNVRDLSYSSSTGSRIGWVSVDLTDTTSSSKFTSVATRGIVKPGDGAMFAAFEILGDSTSKIKIFLRGRGASLANFGVSNVLPNPMLKLYQYNDTNDYTKGSTLVLENNDYTTQSNHTEIADKAQLLLSQPLSSTDPGMIVELGAGYYSIKFEAEDASSGNGWIGIDDITP